MSWFDGFLMLVFSSLSKRTLISEVEAPVSAQSCPLAGLEDHLRTLEALCEGMGVAERTPWGLEPGRL